MRKDQLVRALARLAKSDRSRQKDPRSRKTNGKASSSDLTGGNKKSSRGASDKRKSKSRAVERKLKRAKAEILRSKDLAFRDDGGGNGCAKDRLVLMVRDPYWLHAYWELTRQSVHRAQAALGQHWHGAKPVLRLLEVTRDGTTSTAQKLVRDIDIHGGVNNWYIEAPNPPKNYRTQVGYLALNGKFFCLARSNVVSTPAPGSGNSLDGNWADVADDCERIYAMSGGYGGQGETSDLREVFEERLRRPMGSPMATRFGIGAGAASGHRRSFHLDIDAELVVLGRTDPESYVTIRGEPVRLHPDGSFTVRFSLPDCRQVLPVVAASPDGVEQRTVVLAIERNTKVMEPVIRDPNE